MRKLKPQPDGPAPISKIKKDKAALDRLKELAESGSITAETVVAEAAHVGSPLHRYLEWDNSKAAYSHRLHQARLLLNEVKIEVTTTFYTVDVPVYPREGKGSSKPLHIDVETVTDEERKAALCCDAITRAIGHLKTAIGYAHYFGMSNDFTSAENMITDLSELMENVERDVKARKAARVVQPRRRGRPRKEVAVA